MTGDATLNPRIVANNPYQVQAFNKMTPEEREIFLQLIEAGITPQLQGPTTDSFVASNPSFGAAQPPQEKSKEDGGGFGITAGIVGLTTLAASLYGLRTGKFDKLIKGLKSTTFIKNYPKIATAINNAQYYTKYFGKEVNGGKILGGKAGGYWKGVADWTKQKGADGLAYAQTKWNQGKEVLAGLGKASSDTPMV